MKSIKEYIIETKEQYEIKSNYGAVAKSVCHELEKVLPAWPKHKSTNLQSWQKNSAGKFWWNDSDIVRYKCENAKYIGYKLKVMITVDRKVNNIDPERMIQAFEQIFKTQIIKEGIFDNNIDKKMPEYEYVNKLYSALSSFFNTKDFSSVPFSERDWRSIIPASEMKQLITRPTIERDGFKVALWGVEPNFTGSASWNDGIDVTIVIYEEKDPAKLAGIKAKNNAKIAMDCVGRELKVGDTVAYNVRGIADGWSPLPVGEIVKVSKEQVEIDGRKVYGFRCCLISRKDGKRIE